MSDKIQKKEDSQDLAQSEMMETLMETILPKVQPFIKPATEKLKNYINSGHTLLLQSYEGKPYVFLIKTSDIESFTLNSGKKPIDTFDVEELIGKILKGDFSSF